MEPVTTFTTAWTVVKTAGDITKKLNEVWKNLKDRDTKHQVEEILDKVHELKQEAAALEDENRVLREKLRFKSDAYEFRTPFWYSKAHPERALCAQCFAKNIEAPMGEQGQDCDSHCRRCLVCREVVRIDNSPRRSQVPGYGGNKTPRDISDLDPDF